MDLNDYWQENKRFVSVVAFGVVGFFLASFLIDAVYGDDLSAAQSKVTRLQRELKKPLFSASDRTAAQAQNDELRAAVERLHEAVQFVPREEFRLDPALGTPSNQYLRALTRVREDLLPRANRANVGLDPGLGMPKLSPTREEEIERYLEALDVIETSLRMAIDAGVRRVDKIQIKLDPGLSTRVGLGRIERTRIPMTLIGDSLALTRLLAATQRPADGRILHVDEIEMLPSRNKQDEVRLDLTLVVARLSRGEEEVEG